MTRWRDKPVVLDDYDAAQLAGWREKERSGPSREIRNHELWSQLTGNKPGGGNAMPKLIVVRHVYDGNLLEAWTKRQRNVLPFPAASANFVRLLKRKVRGRAARTPRFFGEAFVASQTPHREAYYGSCKWLTNKHFADNEEFPKGAGYEYQEQFRKALQKHFGHKRIQRLQRAVHILSRSCRKELDGKQPTAPDLWLVDRRGRHRFIEVKLPGDSVAPHQLAGMAAIACVLKGPKRVSVEVIHLHDDDRLFKNFCRSMRAG